MPYNSGQRNYIGAVTACSTTHLHFFLVLELLG
jgi:hypothetical protein